MKAKLIKEYLDPTQEKISETSLVDWDMDDYGVVTYQFENDGRIGEKSVEIWEIADFYGIDEEEMENNPHAISDKQIEEYSKNIDPRHIEWGEDERPNPDEIRDWKYDR